MTASVMINPQSKVVLPLMPEMLRNECPDQKGNNADTEPKKKSYEKQKQDCERNAAKRLLEKHGAYYKELKATILGDDLYANHNTCKDIIDRGLGFIFTCKDDSHPWVAEQFQYSEPETLVNTNYTGKYHFENRYKWVNGIENRADGEKLLVNYI
jgi:hypothetical protein